MELSDFIVESASELRTWNLAGKFRLVGTIDFHLRDNPKAGYCVDYYYNGKGRLHEEVSWVLNHINMHQEGTKEQKISQQQLDIKLRPYGVSLWDVFYGLLLKRLEGDYPAPQ